MRGEIPTLKTSVYKTVHKAADTNKDGKLTLREISIYESYIPRTKDVSAFFAAQKATNHMIEDFNSFAKPANYNAGKPNEDTYITLNDIVRFASVDGHPEKISPDDKMTAYPPEPPRPYWQGPHMQRPLWLGPHPYLV